MSRRRVVVTGMGMLSPLGNDVPSSWQGILAGRSGIGLLEHMDLSAFSTRFGGAVKNFNVEEYLSAKEARKLDLFIQYGLAASFQAMRNSGLEVTDANRERIGVAMGSGIGGLTNIENNCKSLHEQGPRRISPFFVPGSIINMISGFLSIHWGLQGPNYAIATACTTGTHCIGMAARNIVYGEADVMVAGVLKWLLVAWVWAALVLPVHCLRAMTTRPKPAARGTRTVTALCYPTALALWCWKSWSTPRRVARPSMPDQSALA